MAEDGQYSVNINVPLITEREAEICYNVLSIEKEPVRSKVSKVIESHNNNLTVSISAPEARQLRVALTSFMDQLSLVIETINEFGPSLSKEYSYK